MLLKKTVLALAAVASFASIGAHASVVFQSDPNITTGFADQRGEGSAAVGRVSVTTTQSINQIGVLNYLAGAGTQDVKFFIANASTGTLDYLSNAKTFANDGTSGPSGTADLNYKLSDVMSFTFVAGTTYSVGYISNGSNFSFADFNQTNSANGFTSLLGNQNISNYANPELNTGVACCSIGFELLAADAPAANVPEPGSVALFGLGILGLQLSLRRKSKT